MKTVDFKITKSVHRPCRLPSPSDFMLVAANQMKILSFFHATREIIALIDQISLTRTKLLLVLVSEIFRFIALFHSPNPLAAKSSSERYASNEAEVQ